MPPMVSDIQRSTTLSRLGSVRNPSMFRKDVLDQATIRNPNTPEEDETMKFHKTTIQPRLDTLSFALVYFCSSKIGKLQPAFAYFSTTNMNHSWHELSFFLSFLLHDGIPARFCSPQKAIQRLLTTILVESFQENRIRRIHSQIPATYVYMKLGPTVSGAPKKQQNFMS